jgi:AcrR family transcriptional regulator
MASTSKTGTSGISKRRSAAKEVSTVEYKSRRKEIAETAVRVFNQRGFTGASISAFATELGIDRASLYYYFSSKEELFDDILSEAIERNVFIATQIMKSRSKPRRKLYDVIVALMTFYEDHYPLIYIYIRENLSHVKPKRTAWSRHMRSLNRQYEDALISIIEEGYADKSFRNIGPSRIVAYGIIGTLGWTSRWFRPGKTECSAEEIGRTFAEMIVSGLEIRH